MNIRLLSAFWGFISLSALYGADTVITESSNKGTPVTTVQSVSTVSEQSNPYPAFDRSNISSQTNTIRPDYPSSPTPAPISNAQTKNTASAQDTVIGTPAGSVSVPAGNTVTVINRNPEAQKQVQQPATPQPISQPVVVATPSVVVTPVPAPILGPGRLICKCGPVGMDRTLPGGNCITDAINKEKCVELCRTIPLSNSGHDCIFD